MINRMLQRLLGAILVLLAMKYLWPESWVADEDSRALLVGLATGGLFVALLVWTLTRSDPKKRLILEGALWGLLIALPAASLASATLQTRLVAVGGLILGAILTNSALHNKIRLKPDKKSNNPT